MIPKIIYLKISLNIQENNLNTYYQVIEDDKDYINELEIYLKNLNLSEPYYEYMVKKEKYGKTLRLTHICTIKVSVQLFLYINQYVFVCFCNYKNVFYGLCLLRDPQ